jgi:hypothetical protein
MREYPEPVFTVYDWYDGPRSGAAEHQGQPVWYRSLFLDDEDYEDEHCRFELRPLTAEALGWEEERQAIYGRWEATRTEADRRGPATPLEEFGALPEERERYRELNRRMDEYIRTTAPTIVVRGEFELGNRRVAWLPLPPAND